NVDPPMNPASQDANAQEHPYNGDDATRPLNLIQLRYTYKTAPGATRSVTTHTVTLRADRRLDLTPDWQLAFRTDLPVLATNPITSDNPEGHIRYGMGDAEFQGALIHDFNERWAAGFGAKPIAPRHRRPGQRKMAGHARSLLPRHAARDRPRQLLCSALTL